MQSNLASRLPFLLLLACTAFPLNWLWEMLQMPAYAEMAGLSWWTTALRCAVAALGDVALTLAVYGYGALATGRLRWTRDAKWRQLTAVAVLSAVVGSAVEWQALFADRWHYNEQMPVVPLLDIGIWPLLQLPLLVTLSVAFANRITEMLERRMKPQER